jgi:ribonuclease PH
LLLDLCYEEDFAADVDFNVVVTAEGGLVELQGATEARPFPRRMVPEVVALAYRGLEPLFRIQREVTGNL